jgi:hypothetical protein
MNIAILEKLCCLYFIDSTIPSITLVVQRAMLHSLAVESSCIVNSRIVWLAAGSDFAKYVV